MKFNKISTSLSFGLMCILFYSPAEGANSEYMNNEYLLIDFKGSEEVIINPDMGLFVSGWNHNKRTDIPGYINIVYRRFTWRELESEEGVYDFSKIQKYISHWRNQGVRVGFRVMSSSIGKGTLAPDYIFNSGVPRVRHKPMKHKHWHTHDEQDDPVYWHPVYLKKYEKFIKAMGSALEGGSGVEFIDIGGIGIFGEMHMATFIKGMWTKDELKKHGFSHQVYFDAYKEMIAMYKEAFKNTRIFLNISRYKDIADYAAKQGIGLRFDGLSSKGNHRTRSIVSNTFRDYCGVNAVIDNPVLCMYEFGTSDHQVAINALEDIPNAPVSYLHLNLGKSNKWSEKLRGSIKKIGKKLGYRIVPTHMTLPKWAKLEDSIKLNQYWKNEGNALPQTDLEMKLMITDRCGEVISKITKSDIIYKSDWKNTMSVKITSTFKLPIDLKSNEYKLQITVGDPSYPGYNYQLGVSGRDKKGKYSLADFNVVGDKAYFSVTDANSNISCDG